MREPVHAPGVLGSAGDWGVVHMHACTSGLTGMCPCMYQQLQLH